MAQIKALVDIEGIRPFLWNSFGPDALPLEKQERTGVAGNNPFEWKKTVLKTKDGRLYIDPSYVFGCLRNAAKYTKKGKASIQTSVSATLQVMDNLIFFENRNIPEDIENLKNEFEEPVYLDVRSVVNPGTRGRNIRYRVAASPGWKLKFNIQWDNTIVSRQEMQAVINDAAMLVGLGDARNIGFGRFKINTFDILEA